jgi:indolepyruvate decarboxylase
MTKQNVGTLLIHELHRRGVRHIFGIPGDYILGFYSLLEKSPLRHIGTTCEDTAGFAADAYARVRGLGAVCVTYCVGGFNLLNAVAEAYAEKSPVVVISGAPGMKEREKDPLLHHRVREFTTQKEIFEKITAASTLLDDPGTAPDEIRRVLTAAQTHKRPVYIELPRDMTLRPVRSAPSARASQPSGDKKTLQEALAESVEMINKSRRPVILADVEMHRFGLQHALVTLAEKTNIPVAATLLGKSVMSEVHPLYLGVYEGALGHEEVRIAVESSDCLLMLGCFLTDINMGIGTARLDVGNTINATSEKIMVRHHRYEGVLFEDFIHGLLRARVRRRAPAKIARVHHNGALPFQSSRRITTQRLFDLLNDRLRDNTVVIADVGDSLFGAVDLKIHRRTEFFSPAYYTSMGFGVPAALGAQLARPSLRPVVLVGDGAFQMTGMELSTIARWKLNPIVIVLDNQGYGTERFIQDGAFNDIPRWAYHEVTKLFGAGRGFKVRTEGDFVQAFQMAEAEKSTFSLINVQLEKMDRSRAMDRFAKRLSQKARS